MSDLVILFVGFLEMTFIMVLLCLALHLRRTLGLTTFMILFGAMLILSQFIMAAQMEIIAMQIGDFAVKIPLGWVILRPCLTALLLVYITEGTLSTQRMIFGVIVAMGVFYYITKLTQIQGTWVAYSLSGNAPAATLEALISQIMLSVVSTLISLIAAIFVMPIVYTKLRNLHLRLYLRLFGALAVSALICTLINVIFDAIRGTSTVADLLGAGAIDVAMAAYLAVIAWLYLSRIEKEPDDTRDSRPLELVLAFLGGYSKSIFLERNLSEWENRHKMLMQNASDMILLLDADGVIKDANFAAAQALHCSSADELIDKVNFFELAGITNNITGELDDATGHGIRRKISIATDSGALVIDLTLSEIVLRSTPMIMLMGRDVTEEEKSAAERAALSEQVGHLQRLEALGKLTGGIAHDFNNYIHAILGHLDLIEMKYANIKPDMTPHLRKIADVAEQAGRLTGQLLGFARKGKYQVVKIDLRKLATQAVELFLPNNKTQPELILDLPDSPLFVRGDMLQLQQVMLNLLLNAVDALRDNPADKPPVLTIAAGRAAASPIPPEPPLPVGKRERPPININDYYFVMVSDNGSGMDRETLEHAFDPFFTTKLIGEGTGMGLPMVYGAITNHYGWVQIKSKLDFGTSVLLFLPTATAPQRPIQSEVKL